MATDGPDHQRGPLPPGLERGAGSSAPMILPYKPQPELPRPASATSPGGLRLFRVWGITVFLHWSWFIVAMYQIQQGRGNYRSVFWSIAEYLSLFAIVLMHEFGHALACRSVGGFANRIMLWPLGGVAYVSPPPRPGAMLWSIAAGPLVNVALLPIFYALYAWSRGMGPDLREFTERVAVINLVLLIFNMLPIYPLDGGQILQSLLWFWLGRGLSLMVAACIGMAGAAGMLVFAFKFGGNWFFILAAFAGWRAWAGIQQAQRLLARKEARAALTPPAPIAASIRPSVPIGNAPAAAPLTPSRTAQCLHCGTQHNLTACLDCGRFAPIVAWMPVTVMPFEIPGAFSARPVVNPPVSPTSFESKDPG